jgi:26S proteasome regulatory subunit N8
MLVSLYYVTQAVFYLDHNYLENMLAMFRKINAKERVIGFYSTGPQIRSNDLRIYDIVERYTGNYTNGMKNTSIPSYPAVFSIIDIRPHRSDLPVTSYKVMEEVGVNRKTADASTRNQQVQRVFTHIPTSLGAVEAEEVGVEHLLRDIHDPTISTVASLIQEKVTGLATLRSKLGECQAYLETCIQNSDNPSFKANPDIIANLQTIVSLLPNLNTNELIQSLMKQTNDMYMAIYLASLVRTILALHDLINNKIRYGADGMYDIEEEMEQQQQQTKKLTVNSTNTEEKKE